MATFDDPPYLAAQADAAELTKILLREDATLCREEALRLACWLDDDPQPYEGFR